MTDQHIACFILGALIGFTIGFYCSLWIQEKRK